MHLLRLTLHDRTTSPNSTIVARTVQGTSLSLTYSLAVPEMMPLPRLTYNLITNWALFNQLFPHFVLLIGSICLGTMVTLPLPKHHRAYVGTRLGFVSQLFLHAGSAILRPSNPQS